MKMSIQSCSSRGHPMTRRVIPVTINPTPHRVEHYRYAEHTQIDFQIPRGKMLGPPHANEQKRKSKNKPAASAKIKGLPEQKTTVHFLFRKRKSRARSQRNNLLRHCFFLPATSSPDADKKEVARPKSFACLERYMRIFLKRGCPNDNHSHDSRSCKKAAKWARGTGCCFRVVKSFTETTFWANSSGPTINAQRAPMRSAYLNCLPSFAGSG